MRFLTTQPAADMIGENAERLPIEEIRYLQVLHNVNGSESEDAETYLDEVDNPNDAEMIAFHPDEWMMRDSGYEPSF